MNKQELNARLNTKETSIAIEWRVEVARTLQGAFRPSISCECLAMTICKRAKLRNLAKAITIVVGGRKWCWSAYARGMSIAW